MWTGLRAQMRWHVARRRHDPPPRDAPSKAGHDRPDLARTTPDETTEIAVRHHLTSGDEFDRAQHPLDQGFVHERQGRW